MIVSPDLIEEMEYYLNSRMQIADRFIIAYRNSFGADESALLNHHRILDEIHGVLDFLEIIYGLSAYTDKTGAYHIQPKEYILQ